MIKEKLFFLLLIFLQLGCHESKIQKLNIDSFLEHKALVARKTGKAVNLNLCKINSFNWDKLIIVSPYTPVEKIRKYNLENSKYVEKHLLGILYQESHCLLLFVEKNMVIRYSYASYSDISFNYINNIDTIKTLPRNLACKLYVKDSNIGLKLFHPELN
ncbi:MAG: hypothetical protein EOO96_20405 [Pedobacter sp.]|nr:MAG: hypothetical protein EOO96_20405 [Pedobacter sp.]